MPNIGSQTSTTRIRKIPSAAQTPSAFSGGQRSPCHRFGAGAYGKNSRHCAGSPPVSADRTGPYATGLVFAFLPPLEGLEGRDASASPCFMALASGTADKAQDKNHAGALLERDQESELQPAQINPYAFIKNDSFVRTSVLRKRLISLKIRCHQSRRWREKKAHISKEASGPSDVVKSKLPSPPLQAWPSRSISHFTSIGFRPA